MKNQTILVPVEPLGTLNKILDTEKLGAFFKNLINYSLETGITKIKDSDILTVLATTVSAEAITTDDNEPTPEDAPQNNEETVTETDEEQPSNEDNAPTEE